MSGALAHARKVWADVPHARVGAQTPYTAGARVGECAKMSDYFYSFEYLLTTRASCEWNAKHADTFKALRIEENQ